MTLYNTPRIRLPGRFPFVSVLPQTKCKIKTDKFVVISCNQHAPPIRIHMDAACRQPEFRPAPDREPRPTSHVLVAMTPAHLATGRQAGARSPEELPDQVRRHSCDPHPVCVHMDAVCASNSDSALIQAGAQRQTAHILLAACSAWSAWNSSSSAASCVMEISAGDRLSNLWASSQLRGSQGKQNVCCLALRAGLDQG